MAPIIPCTCAGGTTEKRIRFGPLPEASGRTGGGSAGTRTWRSSLSVVHPFEVRLCREGVPPSIAPQGADSPASGTLLCFAAAAAEPGSSRNFAPE